MESEKNEPEDQVRICGNVISLGPKLTPDCEADQQSPRGFYIYGHFDKNGAPFYIGKGTKRRAWQDDRHPLWKRYVDSHLGGRYHVVILKDGLTSEDAEELEQFWIAQESHALVNWANYSRKTDFAECERFHRLRDENRALAARARLLEKTNLPEAISLYLKALKKIKAYATIQPEGGLIGRLIEELHENGIHGDVAILERLSFCLGKAGRFSEARNIVEAYFKTYRADRSLRAGARIRERLARERR